jgi:hypothetical protein
MRRAILERFREQHGDKRIRLLNDKGVEKLLATLPPWAQRNWLKTLRGLAAFCIDDGLIATDPTTTVKLGKAKAGEGAKSWPPEAIEQFAPWGLTAASSKSAAERPMLPPSSSARPRPHRLIRFLRLGSAFDASAPRTRASMSANWRRHRSSVSSRKHKS